MPEGDTPPRLARKVGLVTIGVIIVVLAIFLVVTLLEGDRTDDLGPGKPSTSPGGS
jgi:hypothetical protein